MYIFNKRRLFVKIAIVNIIVYGLLYGAWLILGLSLESLDLSWMVVVSFFIVIAINFVCLEYFYFKPLYVLTKEIAALLSGKKYSRILLKSKDEFGLIAYFFNHMTQNLENVSPVFKEWNRMTNELTLASQIQKNILPSTYPIVDGLDMVVKTRSAEEVGGDSFDIEYHNDQYYFYIGDVTGHGAPAGLIMMMVNTLFDVFLKNVSNTQELATLINKELKPRVNNSFFMTTSFFRWLPKERRMFYTGAGHENIIIYRAKERISEVFPAGGIALAMTEDINNLVQEKEIILNDSDFIILYTDGITESINSTNEFFGLDRLVRCVNKYGHLGNSSDIFKAITKEIESFIGNTVQLDDMTLFVIGKNNKKTISDDWMLNNIEWDINQT